MPVFRTPQTANFGITPNAIAFNDNLSGNATAAILYFISKPTHWKFNARDLKRRLNIGMNKVYRVMQELIRAGYASYYRIQSGTIWNFYDTPQNTEIAASPVDIDRVNTEHVENSCDLERIDFLEIKKQQHVPLPIREKIPEVVPIQEQKPVVVSFEEKEHLVYPEKLTKDQKKACKSVIKKAPVALQQDVLFELAYRMTLQNIRSIPGFLNTLVTAANNGTFTRTGAIDAVNKINPAIAKTKVIQDYYATFKYSEPDVQALGIQGLRSALKT